MDKYTYFWTIIIIAMAFFFVGVYKNVVQKIGYILWVNQREDEKRGRGKEARALSVLLKIIVRESLLQWRITERSSFLWLRHVLIFAGFLLLFFLDGLFALTTKYWPVAYFESGAGRGWLKLGLELTGSMLLLGLTLGLIHRIIYSRQERSFIDFKALLLLWAIVATGFLTETARLVLEPEDPYLGFSILAAPMAGVLAPRWWDWEKVYAALWILHATMTSFFFAYIPFSKFVHLLVSPIGRSVTMGEGFVEKKRKKITEGLL